MESSNAAKSLVEACLRFALPAGSDLPRDDEDWVESGLLDSMAHVEVLSCIEKAAHFPDLFAQVEGAAPATIRSAVAVVERALSEQTERKLERATRSPQRLGDRKGAALVGWGFTLGSDSIPSSQVEREFSLQPGTLKERAGIEAIRRTSQDQTEISLATTAAREALRIAGISAQSLHWIIGASETFLGVPSFAASLHTSLLAPSACRALDVGGACVGLLNCLAVADALIAADRAECILVATADLHGRIFIPGKVPGEFGCLFGDGASAFILKRSEPAGTGPYSILTTVGSCAGTFRSLLQIRPRVDGSLSFDFEGDALALAALDRMERIISDLEITSGKNRDEASAFAIHQPNPRLMEVCLRRMKLPPEKVPIIGKTRGNLGASTCGVALSMALEDHSKKPPSERGPIFVAAVGPGMLWAGAVLE